MAVIIVDHAQRTSSNMRRNAPGREAVDSSEVFNGGRRFLDFAKPSDVISSARHEPAEIGSPRKPSRKPTSSPRRPEPAPFEEAQTASITPRFGRSRHTNSAFTGEASEERHPASVAHASS